MSAGCLLLVAEWFWVSQWVRRKVLPTFRCYDDEWLTRRVSDLLVPFLFVSTSGLLIVPKL